MTKLFSIFKETPVRLKERKKKQNKTKRKDEKTRQNQKERKKIQKKKNINRNERNQRCDRFFNPRNSLFFKKKIESIENR